MCVVERSAGMVPSMCYTITYFISVVPKSVAEVCTTPGGVLGSPEFPRVKSTVEL